MTDKILNLADAYSLHRQRSAIFSISTQEARAALAAAIKAEQDYTAAVISERDGLHKLLSEALVQRNCYMRDEEDAILELKAVCALLDARTVERDTYQRCADDMAMAHKVERDGLIGKIVEKNAPEIARLNAYIAELKQANSDLAGASIVPDDKVLMSRNVAQMALEALRSTGSGEDTYQVVRQWYDEHLVEAAEAALREGLGTWQQDGTTDSAKTTTADLGAGSQTGLVPLKNLGRFGEKA